MNFKIGFSLFLILTLFTYSCSDEFEEIPQENYFDVDIDMSFQDSHPFYSSTFIIENNSFIKLENIRGREDQAHINFVNSKFFKNLSSESLGGFIDRYGYPIWDACYTVESTDEENNEFEKILIIPFTKPNLPSLTSLMYVLFEESDYRIIITEKASLWEVAQGITDPSFNSLFYFSTQVGMEHYIFDNIMFFSGKHLYRNWHELTLANTRTPSYNVLRSCSGDGGGGSTLPPIEDGDDDGKMLSEFNQSIAQVRNDEIFYVYFPCENDGSNDGSNDGDDPFVDGDTGGPGQWFWDMWNQFFNGNQGGGSEGSGQGGGKPGGNSGNAAAEALAFELGIDTDIILECVGENPDLMEYVANLTYNAEEFEIDPCDESENDLDLLGDAIGAACMKNSNSSEPVTVEDVFLELFGTEEQVVEKLECLNIAANPCELALMMNPNFGPSGFGIYANSYDAFEMTDQVWGSVGTGVNDCKDAFRHGYYQAINAKEYGAVVTLMFADAHECGEDTEASRMDLRNNAVGIGIGSNCSEPCTPEQIAAEVCQKLENGEMSVLSSPNNPFSLIISSGDCECPN